MSERGKCPTSKDAGYQLPFILFRHYISGQSKPCQNDLSRFGVLGTDDLAHEFMVAKLKHDLDKVNDPEELRTACLLLIDLLEKQKIAFKSLMGGFIEEGLR